MFTQDNFMEIESELTHGRKSEKKVIKCYNEVINEFGVESVYISKMRIYFLTAEKCYFSVSYVRQILSKYFNGKIRP